MRTRHIRAHRADHNSRCPPIKTHGMSGRLMSAGSSLPLGVSVATVGPHTPLMSAVLEEALVCF